MNKQIPTAGVITAGVLLGISILMAGCVSTSDTKQKPPSQPPEWQTVADRAVSITPLPSPAGQSDETVLEDMIATDRERLKQKGAAGAGQPRPAFQKLPTLPLTLKMHDVSLPVLLRTFARVADLDIMINDSVQGQAKIFVTNVPWDQAFLGILDTFGLSYEWSGNILRIISVDDLAKKQALMEARQNYEKMKNSHDLALMSLDREKSKLEPLVTKIVKIRYADLKSLQANLTSYLSPQAGDSPSQAQSQAPGNGAITALGLTGGAAASPAPTQSRTEIRSNIIADEFSNTLIIHATRPEIIKLMPIIRRLDQPIRQVLIEAHIVEAEASTGKELGIQWGGLGTLNTGNDKSISVGGNIAESGTDLETGITPTDGNIVNLPITSTTGMAFGVMAQKVGEYVLYTQLQALEQEGLLNILSKPSITTLDHRKAVIKSGKEVPFQTVENDEVSVEFKEAVVKLEVTPHIIDDNIIRLEIVTHKDELDFTNDVNGNPTIVTKNAETTVLLFDGQTTVIGGLNKEKTSDSEDGVPGLRKIPGLGWFFKSIDTSKEMEELLIFITPHILKGRTAAP